MTQDANEPSSGAGEQPAAEIPTPLAAAASAVFGDRLPLARAFTQWLAGPGIERGLIGPRETQRLWDRHLLNSAAVSELLPIGARVVDVGSGAGLPGIPLAIRRPDLQVELVEPMLRRTTFLEEVVRDLGLVSVRVVRGRADEPATVRAVGGADWVVARAVAPLDRLARWCLPLLVPGGRLIAIKGESAEEELAQYRSAMTAMGTGDLRLRRLQVHDDLDPVVVVVAQRSPATGGRGAVRPRTRSARGAGRSKREEAPR